MAYVWIPGLGMQIIQLPQPKRQFVWNPDAEPFIPSAARSDCHVPSSIEKKGYRVQNATIQRPSLPATGVAQASEPLTPESQDSTQHAFGRHDEKPGAVMSETLVQNSESAKHICEESWEEIIKFATWGEDWEDLIQFALGSCDEKPEAMASEMSMQSFEAAKHVGEDSWEEIVKLATANATHDALSEADTQFDAQSLSSEEENEVGLTVNVQGQTAEAQYTGSWTQARISASKLTWNEGEDVEIQCTSSTTFTMKYLGSTYHAKLQGDCKLHWSDGDVWTRKIEEVEQAAPVKLLPPWLARNQRRKITREQDATNSNSAAEHEAKNIVKELDQAVAVKLLPPWLVRSRRRGITREQDAAISNSTVEHETIHTACVQVQSVNDREVATNAAMHVDVTTKETVVGTQDKAEEVMRMDVQSESGSSQKRDDRDFAMNLPRDVVEAVLMDCEEVGSHDSAVMLQHRVKDTNVHSSASWNQSKTPAITLQPLSNREYRGVVKYFRGSFGWIVCGEIAADYPDCDVMVHKLDCAFRPGQGDEVSFRLALNERGNPQAMQVRMCKALEINARDWFAERESRRNIASRK
jgi:hypothetical protein